LLNVISKNVMWKSGLFISEGEGADVKMNGPVHLPWLSLHWQKSWENHEKKTESFTQFSHFEQVGEYFLSFSSNFPMILISVLASRIVCVWTPEMSHKSVGVNCPSDSPLWAWEVQNILLVFGTLYWNLLCIYLMITKNCLFWKMLRKLWYIACLWSFHPLSLADYKFWTIVSMAYVQSLWIIL